MIGLEKAVKSAEDTSSTNNISTACPLVSTANENAVEHASTLQDNPDMTEWENEGIFDDAYDDQYMGAEADYTNLDTTLTFSPIPITRVHKDHPVNQIIGEWYTLPQTRSKVKKNNKSALVSQIKKIRRTNHKDYHNCLFSCFLSQTEPKIVSQALEDPSWIEAMQDELL